MFCLSRLSRGSQLIWLKLKCLKAKTLDCSIDFWPRLQEFSELQLRQNWSDKLGRLQVNIIIFCISNVLKPFSTLLFILQLINYVCLLGFTEEM